MFDIQKLRWMNGEYLKAMDPEAFYAQAEPYLKEAVKGPYDLRRIAEMVRTRIEVFPDIAAQVDFFDNLPDYDPQLFCNKKWKVDVEKAKTVLEEMLPRLEAAEDFTNDALYALITEYAAEKGVKTGFVIWPLRIALSGKSVTPAGATELLEVFGKEESLRRIASGIEKCQNAAE